MSIIGKLLGGAGAAKVAVPSASPSAQAKPAPSQSTPAKPGGVRQVEDNRPRRTPFPAPQAAQRASTAVARVESQSKAVTSEDVDGSQITESFDGQTLPWASKKVAEADRETLAMLADFKGRVLTASDGPAPVNASQAQFVAMLSNGYLVVSKSHTMHSDVSTVRSLLQRKGIVWKRQVGVDLAVIQRLYARAERTSSGSGKQSDTVAMQRKVIEIIGQAASLRASDIHVTVHRWGATLEFRIDSIMVKQYEIRPGEAMELCLATFNMSDVSDPTYLPFEQQGARITEASLKGARFPEGVQSIRLQFSPLAGMGRYMVMRLLYDQSDLKADTDVHELGYAGIQIRQIQEMRRRPFGINIVSGPTGSGKSTTLQRGLIALMRERPGKNLLTIEDPPEYIIPGARQIPVSNAATAEERREKFRQAINGSMRADPDIIMIGEIRDKASASLAFEAAMTGHGVWTTLHANDAISILDRLRDIGVELYNLCDASLVTGLIGQRLVRLTAEAGAIPFEEGVTLGFISPDKARLLRNLAGDRVSSIMFAGTGDMMDRKHFRGRTVVAETVLTDQDLLDTFRAGDKPAATRYWLDNLDGVTMLEHAFVKMCDGLVDPREVEDKIGPLERLRPDRIDRVFSIIGK